MLNALVLARCHQAQRIFIGYSGGVDSHVLLHLLAHIPTLKSKLHAVYIDHGLQACALTWVEHTQQIACTMQVNYQVIKVHAQPVKRQSPEEAARDARYHAFKNLLSAGDCVVFAQHRQDQLETVLLQMFRGAGLKGLSGMPLEIAFGEGILLRPLLDTSQTAILAYAQQQSLKWVEDPSNQNSQFDRNYLRNEVMPLLQQRWPQLDKTVARAAKNCAEGQALLSGVMREKMLALLLQPQQSLCIVALRAYTKQERQVLIREWLAYLNHRMPSAKLLQAILDDVLPVEAKQAKVEYDNVVISAYRQQLYCYQKKLAIDTQVQVHWRDRQVPLPLKDNGELSLLMTDEVGIAKKYVDEGDWQIKYRQGGEKIALSGRAGRHTLKALYQEMGVLPWLRVNIPLLYIDNCLAAIGDYYMSADFLAMKTEVGLQVNWQRENG